MNYEIKTFSCEHYDDVQKLLSINGLAAMPSFEKIDGYGLVLLELNQVVGFIWALVSEKSTYAFVNFFAVEESKRDRNYGVILMTKMLIDLMKMGKEIILGAVEKKNESLARLYKYAGMKTNESYFVMGSVKPLVDFMKEKYGSNY